MTRKNFLSTDFFVTTSEKEAKRILCLLPQHLPHITFLKENTFIHSFRFLYESQEKGAQFYIDVSILPLNDQYVRFNLHGSYTNGQIIVADAEIGNALTQFEKSIHAVFTNDIESIYPVEVKKATNKKTGSLVSSLLSLFLSKYHY